MDSHKQEKEDGQGLQALLRLKFGEDPDAKEHTMGATVTLLEHRALPVERVDGDLGEVVLKQRTKFRQHLAAW